MKWNTIHYIVCPCFGRPANEVYFLLVMLNTSAIIPNIIRME